MKNSDLSNAIGNVNLKYIEEMENYTSKRMTLTKIISLAACIAILVTAIPAALILNREDGKTDAPVVTTPFNGENNDSDSPINTDAMKVIYCDADMLAVEDEIRKNVLNEKTVDLKVFEKYIENVYDEYQYVENAENIPKTLSINVGTEEIKCTLDYVYNTRDMLSEDETIKSRAKIARYKVNKECFPDYFRDGDGWLLYRVDTKEIVQISIPSAAGTNSGPLTREEIRSLADRDIKILFGEDILSRYTCSEEYISSTGVRKVIYTVKIGDFSTKERISLHYNGNGKFLTLLTNNLGLYDGVLSALSEKNVLLAESEALNIIDGKLVENKYIAMSKNGEPCIFYNCKSLVNGEMKYYKIGYRIK